MIKAGNRKSDILNIIRDLGSLTCAQITSELEVALRKKQDSASVSSTLYKMVQEGILKYSESVGPKGGHIYMLGANPQTRRLVLKIKTNYEPDSNN